MFSLLMGGDVALSIGLTAVTSLVTPLTLPLLLGLFAQYGGEGLENLSVPLLEIFAMLMLFTVVPVLSGMIVCYRRPEFAKLWHTRIERALPILLTILVAYAIKDVGSNAGQALIDAAIPGALLLLTCVPLGYLAGRQELGGGSSPGNREGSGSIPVGNDSRSALCAAVILAA